ncbi:MAG: hypothetical protein LBS00_03185 [Synergistaceae bacterium]|jgi:hypothetical protein|nr:hypothetical protein [Synergistaceae bacterium]
MYRLCRNAAFLGVVILALVVSVDVAPEAQEMLLTRGGGEKDVWIANVFYSCRQGNAFAMVRNGIPEGGPENYDVVDTGALRVHVPKDMKFENDTPKIVVFPRRTGNRDVGVSNVVE